VGVDLLTRAADWRPTPRTVRAACLAALVANIVIVVTGGAVRLTASGLGCPTWPRCTDESLVPTREMGPHGAIEFSNRMLTYVLGIAVAAAIVTTVRQRPRRRVLVLLAVSLFAGIVAQAVLGGITVLTGLNPVTVMAHFLLSALLVGAALVLYWRSGQPDGPARLLVRPELRRLGAVCVGVVALTLFLGTVVTGSGPHSGDRNATHRLPLSPATAAQMHADAVFLLFGLVVALLFALRATGAPVRVRHGMRDLLAVAAAQGLVGYVQYFTKLPVVLVGLHVLGACLVWVAALRAYLVMAEREPLPADPTETHEPAAGTVAVGLP
jgi:cytochrome c oxidase assembly protein subunit 15